MEETQSPRFARDVNGSLQQKSAESQLRAGMIARYLKFSATGQDMRPSAVAGLDRQGTIVG